MEVNSHLLINSKAIARLASCMLKLFQIDNKRSTTQIDKLSFGSEIRSPM